MSQDVRSLLTDVLGEDVLRAHSPGIMLEKFYQHSFTLADLKKVEDFIQKQTVSVNGSDVPSVIRLPSYGEKMNRSLSSEPPYILNIMTHGNEPAGLAGALLTMLLSEKGYLKKPVEIIIANPKGTKEYFDALAEENYSPTSPQSLRDRYRAGNGAGGDPNRVPCAASTSYVYPERLAQLKALYAPGRTSGMLDIHSGRGDMVVAMDFWRSDMKRDEQNAQDYYAPLAGTPFKFIVENFTESLNQSAPPAEASKPLDMIYIDQQKKGEANVTSTVIEAGTHEDPKSFVRAAMYTHSLMHNLGVTEVKPLEEEKIASLAHVKLEELCSAFDKGTTSEPNYSYELMHVPTDQYAKGVIRYRDLLPAGYSLGEDETIYPVKAFESLQDAKDAGVEDVIIEKGNHWQCVSIDDVSSVSKPFYGIYQYKEFERIESAQTVAIALPSGTKLKAPGEFRGLFVSKAAELFDHTDSPPNGCWPIRSQDIDTAKFSYFCADKEPLLLNPRVSSLHL